MRSQNHKRGENDNASGETKRWNKEVKEDENFNFFEAGKKQTEIYYVIELWRRLDKKLTRGIITGSQPTPAETLSQDFSNF